jgi:hypothetical protein
MLRRTQFEGSRKRRSLPGSFVYVLSFAEAVRRLRRPPPPAGERPPLSPSRPPRGGAVIAPVRQLEDA